MIKKISDICILTDVDRTLYTKETGIPNRNIEAIERFKSKGGKFGIATGRALESAQIIMDAVKVNFPCVICNGGAIYDNGKKKYLNQKYLPLSYKKYLKDIYNKYDYISAATITEEGSRCLQDGKERFAKFNYPAIPVKYAPEKLPNKVYKILFSVPEAECSDILKDFQSMGLADVHFSSSDLMYIDMLPKDVNKGTEVAELSNQLNIPMENIITIGDYYNDIDMLAAVPISACVEGSPKELMDICKIHVGKMEDGAIADLIEYLEENYEE